MSCPVLRLLTFFALVGPGASAMYERPAAKS
jgi:hypothetical protein